MTIIIEERYSTNEKFNSDNYKDFSGTLKEDFIKFLLKNNSNLSNSDLSNSDLSNSDLSNSDLRYSGLRYSNLRYSNLSNSDLSNSDLSNSDLSNSDLRYSGLRYSDLRYSNLSNSDLRYSDLSNSDLSNSDLSNSDLRYSNLSNSGLRYSNLSNSNLSIFCRWSVSFTLPFTIHIGCKSKTIKEWDKWFKSDETFDTPKDSKQFKMIYANYLAVRSYLKECHKQKLFHEVEVERNGIKQKEWQVNL